MIIMTQSNIKIEMHSRASNYHFLGFLILEVSWLAYCLAHEKIE